MPEQFSPTVDLKEKMNKEIEKQKAAASKPAGFKAREKNFKEAKQPKRPIKKFDREKARSIDEVYNEEEIQPKKELQIIERPKKSSDNSNVYKKAFFALIGLLIVSVLYWQFIYKEHEGQIKGAATGAGDWYSIKLLNDEIYYGQVEDISADPIIIDNVYYNYDQLNPEGEKRINESGNLRLVKRGKETHGPSGSMSIVRSQVVFMEPLKSESKVLKAILDYEK